MSSSDTEGQSEFIYTPPPFMGLDVLYVSKQVVIVNKPAGLLSVPGRGADRADCLLTRVQTEFPDAMTVHRLDLATSGIVMFGRGPKFQRELSMLFQAGKVEKRYIAVVDGLLINEQGEVNQPLIVDWPNRPKQKIDHETGRPSCTRYQLTDRDTQQNISRVLLEPVTGRSHQLRVHMEYLGHPILGDDLYGTERSRSLALRLMLHASKISFPLPEIGKVISIDCPANF